MSVNKHVVISTEHNGYHQDFHVYEGEDYTELDWLEDYLDSFEYYEDGSLIGRVKHAIEDGRDYIVEPVNGDEDITINFAYIPYI